MTGLRTFISVVIVALSLGCASHPRRQVAADTPLPATTPYDGDPSARSEYLAGYRSGYRDFVAGRVQMPYYEPGRCPVVERTGYMAGVTAAMEDWRRSLPQKASTNAAPDAIDRLVARCEASQRSGGSHFPDGPFSPIALPASASPAELVSLALERQAWGAKHHTTFGILTIRRVRIADESMAGVVDPNYTAVQIRTGSKGKIVLLQFQPASREWWNWVYDAD